MSEEYGHSSLRLSQKYFLNRDNCSQVLDVYILLLQVRMGTLNLIPFAKGSSRTLEIFLRVKFHTIVLTSIYVNLDSFVKEEVYLHEIFGCA